MPRFFDPVDVANLLERFEPIKIPNNPRRALLEGHPTGQLETVWDHRAPSRENAGKQHHFLIARACDPTCGEFPKIYEIET